jgi:hypothetical protein
MFDVPPTIFFIEIILKKPLEMRTAIGRRFAT